METGGLSPAVPTWEQRPLTAGPPDRANAPTHPKSVAPCLDTLMFHTNRFILSCSVLQSALLESAGDCIGKSVMEAHGELTVGFTPLPKLLQ